jgi:hypothetical protein
LYSEGRLSEFQYQNTESTIALSGRRAGVVLVEKGLITTRELFPLVRYHYEWLLFDCFTWKEGACRFEPDTDPAKERILLDLSLPAIIIEGIRTKASRQDIEALVPEGSVPFYRCKGEGCLNDTGLSSLEKEMVEWFDGSRSVDIVADKFFVDEFELRSFVAGLVALGRVEVKGGNGKRLKKEANHGVSLKNEEEFDFSVIKARVTDKLEQIMDGTYFSILEVPLFATGHEIRKSYKRLKGLFSPSRFLASDLVYLQNDVKLINKILDETYEILRNSSLREAYLQAINPEKISPGS